MIVCSCNTISDRTIRATRDGDPGCAGRVAEVFARLDCRPQCGRCATSIRAILRENEPAGCVLALRRAAPPIEADEPDLILAAE